MAKEQPQRSSNNRSAMLADRLRQISHEMTPAEQKVARTLFASGMLAGLDTVAGLAERARVSGPTVIRLASKLQFDSYLSFQRALRAELEERHNLPNSLYDKQPRGDLLDAAQRAFADATAASFRRIAPSEWSAVVALLADPARRIWCAGGRFTKLVAELLYLHLVQIRSDAHLLAEGLQSRTDQLIDIDRRCVLFVYDVRRYQADTVELARGAKERGAAIVLVTDPWQSPIAEFADRVLVVEVSSKSGSDSMIPAFALTEALIGAVLTAAGNRAIARMRELEGLRVGFEYREENRAATRRAKKRSTRHG